MTKKELLALMLPQIEDIVEEWNLDGIIFEGQFDFASSYIIKHCLNDVYSIIIDNGGHELNDSLYYDKELDYIIDSPFGAGDRIDNQGWMYYFYDPNIYTSKQATNRALKYFRRTLDFD